MTTTPGPVCSSAGSRSSATGRSPACSTFAALQPFDGQRTVRPCGYTSAHPPCGHGPGVVEERMTSDVTSLIPDQDAAARRLEILTFEEAQDLLRLLQLIVGEGLDELSQEAEWFAREIAARIPSES
ncbi:DUF6417 family protein [Streptomyces sp. NPDC017964]